MLAVAAAAIALGAGPACAQSMEAAPSGMVLVRNISGDAVWQPADTAAMAPVEGAPDLNPVGYDWNAEPVGVPPSWLPALRKAASDAGVAPALLASLVWRESRWNPHAVSAKGAMGLTQLMPATARELGCDPADPTANLLAGARYLRRQLDSFGGDVEMALAAYNAGAGRVRRAGGIPAIRETRDYVAAIVGRSGSARFSTAMLTRQ